jgi:hypothetical protein
MTTAMATPPSTSQAMRTAAFNGTDTRPSDGCKDCNKVGLAILPVVGMPVPMELRNSTSELKALDAHYVADDLKAHWMVLRALPSGYLYVFKADHTWDIYVVDREGLLRMVPSLGNCPASAADQKPMSEQCKRSGDNIPAQVIAVDPTKHASVWLAFSRHRWTAEVLKAYAANKNGCRNKRMTKLDVMAAANGSLGTGSQAKNAVQFGLPMSSRIGQSVADYAGGATREAINRQALEPLQARDSQAVRLAEVMARISSKTASKTGAIIVLPDDLGVAKALNAARNATQVERAQVIKDYVRHDFVRRAAAGFKQQCEKQGDTKRWNEVYSKAFSQAALNDKLNERDSRLKPIDQRLANMGQDWAAWLQRPAMGTLFAHDFDNSNLCEGMQAAIAGADCIHGAGSQPAERSLIQAWVQGEIKDEGNILWTALAGNSKSLLTRLSDHKDLMPAGLDSVKNLWAGVDEFAKSLNAPESALLLSLRAGSQDPVAAAVAKLLHVVATNIDHGISALGRAGSRAVFITALWSGLRAAPMRQNVTLLQSMIDAKAAGWGATAGAHVQTVRKVNMVSWRYNLLEATDVLAARGGVAVMQTRFVVLQIWQRTGWVDVGEPSTATGKQAGGPPRPTAVASPKVLPSTPNAVRVFGNAVWRRLAAVGGVLREGGANAVMASGVFVFQVMSFNLVSKDLEGSGSDTKALELSAAYFAAMAGMLGAASEVTAASIQVAAKIKGVDLLKVAPRMAGFVRGAAAMGGVLGGASGLAMGLASFNKAMSLEDAGDEDAAHWTYALSVASFAGALTGGFGALTASGAAAASAGTASLVGGTLLGIGPAGWAILTVGAVVIGVYLAYKGAEATDDPIEAWLKRSVAGIAPEKFAAQEEVSNYNELFNLPLEVGMSGSASMGRHTTVVRMAAPPLDKESQLAYRLNIVGANGSSHIVQGQLMLKGGKITTNVPADLMPQHMGAISVSTIFSETDQGALLRVMVESRYMPAGTRDPSTGEILRAAKCAVKQISLAVQYKPLSDTEPAWVLPGPSGQELSYSPT